MLPKRYLFPSVRRPRALHDGSLGRQPTTALSASSASATRPGPWGCFPGPLALPLTVDILKVKGAHHLSKARRTSWALQTADASLTLGPMVTAQCSPWWHYIPHLFPRWLFPILFEHLFHIILSFSPHRFISVEKQYSWFFLFKYL